jgi:hypothetical protein
MLKITHSICRRPYFLNAQEEIKGFYEVNKESVFFIRQLQVKLEKKYYHWVTNNAIIELHLDCPRAIPGGIIDRFDRWDQKRGKGVNSGRNSQEVGVNLLELLGKA